MFNAHFLIVNHLKHPETLTKTISPMSPGASNDTSFLYHDSDVQFVTLFAFLVYKFKQFLSNEITQNER